MKLNTSWNLGLLYKNDSDPAIERDLRELESKYALFAKKYKGKNFTATPSSLAKALRDWRVLEETLGGKPWWYFALKTDLNSDDTKSSALATKYGQRITEAGNKVTFFTLEIAKIPPNKHKLFLKSSLLKDYKYALERTFRSAKYNLPEGEEQLENLLSQPGFDMWVDTQERLLNKQTVKYKGKNIPIPKALSELLDMPKSDRRVVHHQINSIFKSISHVAEGEINAIYNYKKIMDTRRGFAKPYSATIIGNENDEKSVEDFVALVTKYFSVSRRFYKLHAKLIGEKKITYAERSVKIGKIKTKFNFPKSVSMLRTVLNRVDKDYVNIFDSLLANGQIDVFPKRGKKGGAYCWGQDKLPTFLLLNHTDNIRSLETLAHEMGHAIHTELSKSQPPQYRKYSTATAEVASTFFEQVIGEEILKHLSDKEKIVFLHNQILGDINTIFRQIACFNFELELHNKIRKEGQVSKDNIADLMSKHLKTYLGDAVDVTSEDGYLFVHWTHIRDFFYVYTYAYGQLISKALYEKWKQDPSYAQKIKSFLKAGRSMSPEDIFKSIGIDTSKTSFFETGIKSIERDISKLEKMSRGFRAK